jgi:tryptophan-rich sensory protein
MIIVTIRAFAVVDPFASWLLWPYAAWVSFATVLNLAIWSLNR